ncbi:hypothetical protein KIPB_014655, partial [Kipferlia bialata]
GTEINLIGDMDSLHPPHLTLVSREEMRQLRG